MIVCDFHKDENITRWSNQTNSYHCERCHVEDKDYVKIEKDYIEKYLNDAKNKIEEMRQDGEDCLKKINEMKYKVKSMTATQFVNL